MFRSRTTTLMATSARLVLLAVFGSLIASAAPSYADDPKPAPDRFIKGEGPAGFMLATRDREGKTTWAEITKDRKVFATFLEFKRDKDWICIHDASRGIALALPIAGGMCQISTNKERLEWRDFTLLRRSTRLQFLKADGGGDFRYSVRDGNEVWIEVTKDNKLFATFSEYARQDGWIYIQDASRGIALALPIAGGKCQLSTDKEGQVWKDFIELRKAE